MIGRRFLEPVVAHSGKRQGSMMPEPQAESHWRVSLPMYNLPEMQAANAAFWAAIRRELQRQGIESPPGSLDFARRPALKFRVNLL
jgi:hypothetical protein